jgi:hypothetical protein
MPSIIMRDTNDIANALASARVHLNQAIASCQQGLEQVRIAELKLADAVSPVVNSEDSAAAIPAVPSTALTFTFPAQPLLPKIQQVCTDTSLPIPCH